MLAAATSFFGRTNISANYNIGASSPSSSLPGFGSGSRSSTPGPSGSSTPVSASLPTPQLTPTFHVGPWRVQPATHKVTNKRVSVWTSDKRAGDGDRMSVAAKDRIVEALKSEASALGKLRHPNILEMVEPVEETRTEVLFATEPLLSSLYLSIPNARPSPLVELDEVEIQKGILQLCKGLSFLHTSARRIHSNLNPESVLINSAGDWKIGGLGLTIPLSGTDGSPTDWRSPIHDSYLPSYAQRSFDYVAPEYVLDEQLVTASDMYSLGCLIYAVHNKGSPPFRNHNNSASLRENISRGVPGLERFDSDLKELLKLLISRHAVNRPTPEALPSHPFFSSLSISTLNFLERSTFASKTREEKISFMKGLTSVLDRFTEGLRTRKILPSLVEEMKDTFLLPYILPNVFAISNSLTPSQFASLVLPSLKPLFALKEPPQNMITLLDNLSLLQSKTDKAVFREHVLPLVYNALESDHAMVQERALKVVPDLCETIDYAEVQGVLFPRVALVFTKTRILSVKVATLETFLAMVKTLDKLSLTQKLVPLLSRIRTKEPAVMLATLAVQEAMGNKVDREAVATLVLPQLWIMSMGPLLNVSQFQRFMAVIKKLGDRVEREHLQHLKDSNRIEDHTSSGTGATANGTTTGGLDFASLVAGASTSTVKPDAVIENGKSWDDDVWGSLLNDVRSPKVQSPAATSTTFQAQVSTVSPNQPSLPPPLTSPSSFSRPSSNTAASRVPSSTFSPPPLAQSIQSPTLSMSTPPLAQQQPLQPTFPNYTSPSLSPAPATGPLQPSKPNYNVTLPPAAPFQSSPIVPLAGSPPPITMNTMLTPSTPAQPWNANAAKKPGKADWGDFDPLA
ncbi:kinase-like protein [Fomitiporia mediterranea MF3/22]|uniref:kinase-like protein n=1 Tax=Fomitiporia mediterranea (strain MF3/22) TaxID=694068 RepID=UPI0004408FF1|nr:kinase-like protein [Fomitiporia mediterranea MF3/22]EJD05722.1 kinase-like protein [Fomitiporia mediterranea MF3/22]